MYIVTATVTFETCGTLNPASSLESPTGPDRSNASKKSPALIGLPFISVIKLDLLSRNRTRFGAPLFRYFQMEYLNRETVLWGDHPTLLNTIVMIAIGFFFRDIICRAIIKWMVNRKGLYRIGCSGSILRFWRRFQWSQGLKKSDRPYKWLCLNTIYEVINFITYFTGLVGYHFLTLWKFMYFI